jgi:ribose transport system substrate-binding protein
MALFGTLAVLVSACGGGGSSSAGSTEASGAGTSGAAASGEETSEAGASGAETSAAEIVTAPPTTPPTEMPVTQAIKEKPPAKQNVIWLACALETCQGALSEGYKQAAEALGWGFEKINYNTLKAAEGMQTALNKNPDSIFITGVEPNAYESQADEAIKREIPIFNGFVLEKPEPEANGMYMDWQNQDGYGQEAEQIGAWMINDSAGKANVVSVTIPEYPILKAEYGGIQKTFEKCAECSLAELPVTVEDVESGKVPAKIVAYLQQNPDTNYIEFAFSDLLTGAETALEAAGIEGIKFTGVSSRPTVVKEIAEGKVAAWTAQPEEFGGWLSVDAAVRTAQGLPIAPYEKTGKVPTWVIDSKAAAEEVLEKYEGEWPGPEGFKEKFEELWGVGG